MAVRIIESGRNLYEAKTVTIFNKKELIDYYEQKGYNKFIVSMSNSYTGHPLNKEGRKAMYNEYLSLDDLAYFLDKGFYKTRSDISVSTTDTRFPDRGRYKKNFKEFGNTNILITPVLDN